jgi:hypothetical protein
MMMEARYMTSEEGQIMSSCQIESSPYAIGSVDIQCGCQDSIFRPRFSDSGNGACGERHDVGARCALIPRALILLARRTYALQSYVNRQQPSISYRCIPGKKLKRKKKE